MFLFYRIYLSICAFSPSSPSTWSGPCLNRVLIFSWFCSQWEINFSWFLWAPLSLINLETYVEDGELYRDFLTDMNEMNAQEVFKTVNGDQTTPKSAPNSERKNFLKIMYTSQSHNLWIGELLLRARAELSWTHEGRRSSKMSCVY